MKFLVAAGSYERILYGLDVSLEEDGRVREAKNSFAIPAHTGYIKAVASCPRFLVSGGTDETVRYGRVGEAWARLMSFPARIFDLRKRKDVGSLSQHNGSVGALAWTGSSHLLTGGEDGRVGLFRSRDWECLHVLRHKKPVSGLAIHPTGKLALSVGGDRSLCLWNLMTGRQAHQERLAQNALRVMFSPGSGTRYALMSETGVRVYRSDGGQSVQEWTVPRGGRLAAMVFTGETVLAVAGEGTTIRFLSVEEGGQEVGALNTSLSPRIKGLAVIGGVLVAASSAGVIAGWTLMPEGVVGKESAPLFTHSTGLRITCLTATALS